MDQSLASSLKWPIIVTVVCIVGRTGHVVKKVANDLGIPFADTDWQSALEACKPDIVFIATLGGAHYEPENQALAFGAHVFVDKPMTHSSETAAELFDLAKAKGVKTAYAASFRITPAVQHAKTFVQSGAIGKPLEFECISHFNFEKDIPYGWSRWNEEGGGRLHNNFAHKLSIVSSIIGDNITSIIGEGVDDLGRAPIVESVHNFKKRCDFIPKDLNDPTFNEGSQYQQLIDLIRRNANWTDVTHLA